MKRFAFAAIAAALVIGVVTAACPDLFDAATAPDIQVMAMAALAGFRSQGSFTPDGIFAGDEDPQTRKITLVSGQNLKRGSVLGKITVGGKYTLSLSASADGSQTPATILAEDCDASAGDKATIAHFGGVYDENGLTYGAGHTAASAREPLRDVGIKLQSSIR